MCQLDDMRTYYCNLPNFILPQMSVMEVRLHDQYYVASPYIYNATSISTFGQKKFSGC